MVIRHQSSDERQSADTMVRTLSFILLGLVLFAQSGYSKPAEAAPGNFDQLLKELQTTIDKSVSEAKKNLNLPEHPDGAAIVKAIREQSDKAEKTLSDMRAKMEESIKKNPEISGVIDNLKTKIDEAKEKLKKENPEVAANAQKVADTLKTAYDSVTKEMSKINEEVNKKGGVRDDLDNLLKNLIDRGTAAAKDFKTKVDEAIKEGSGKKA